MGAMSRSEVSDKRLSKASSHFCQKKRHPLTVDFSVIGRFF